MGLPPPGPPTGGTMFYVIFGSRAFILLTYVIYKVLAFYSRMTYENPSKNVGYKGCCRDLLHPSIIFDKEAIAFQGG